MTDRDIAQDLAEQVSAAARRGQPLQIMGLGSKAFYGHEVRGEPLNLHQHSGITRYEPTELVITARAGTPIAEINDALAEKGQMLAFEPPLFGGSGTLGGAVASGLAGPRRPWGGAPRDLVLGMTLLDGRGRILRFGGEVMKNVAGYDLSRLMAGALGTLGALLEVSLKVIPAPPVERSVELKLSHDRALQQMRELARQPAPLSAACHLDDTLHLRLSGNAASVSSWQAQIGGEVGDNAFWQGLRDHELPFFQSDRPLWRLSLPPATPRLECEQQVITDWGGAQRWVFSSCSPTEIRQEVAKVGGHAILFRHGDEKTPVFHPLENVRQVIHRGLKRAFDPRGILNPGRQYASL